MSHEGTTAGGSSPRRTELLESAYAYVLEHGIVDLSLRPLASAVGSSPRVLILLFGSKDGLVRALLDRARADELEALRAVRHGTDPGSGIGPAVTRLWDWLSAEDHRPVLRLWVDSYARSITDPSGPWAGFAEASVSDWLTLLAAFQPDPTNAASTATRTQALSILRGAVLDLLATGDVPRLDAAVRGYVEVLLAGQAGATAGGR